MLFPERHKKQSKFLIDVKEVEEFYKKNPNELPATTFQILLKNPKKTIIQLIRNWKQINIYFWSPFGLNMLANSVLITIISFILTPLTIIYFFLKLKTELSFKITALTLSSYLVMLLYFSIQPSYAILLFCLAASTVGFLYWNWAPARIFMGDVGSCTIGFLFGLLSIYTVKIEIVAISVWLILLAPFICDATYTLLKRIANREKWYEAHNSHAYQKIYQMGVSHSKLAMGLLFMNLLVIWPIAYVAHTYNNLEFAMIILSYIVLGAIWLTVQVKYNKFKKVLP